MAGHGRRNSKGSFSIFSLDTIRSFSRAGSRQAIRLPDETDFHHRSPSSLSCDPHRQHPLPCSPDEPSSRNASKVANGGPPSGKHGSLSRSNTSPLPRVNNDLAATDNPDNEKGSDKKSGRARPLSWLTFPVSASNRLKIRSRSTNLPKDTSSSSVARSAISAPILQSTTNEDVARSEGVHRGELFGTDGGQPKFLSIEGLPSRPQSPETGISNADADALAGKIDEAIKQFGSFGNGPNHRSYSNAPKKDRLDKLRQILSSKGRSAKRNMTGELSKLRHDEFSRLKDSKSSSTPVEQGISRRRTETVNLCREKIRSLTGHGHVKRKSVQESHEIVAQEKAREQEHLLGDGDDVVEPLKPECNDHTSEFRFGSLTRSFASAVEKLDFQSSLGSRKKSFLRSKTSLQDITNISNKAMDNQKPSPPAPRRPPPPLPPPFDISQAFRPPPQPFSAGQNHLSPIETSKTESSSFSFQDRKLIPRPDRVSTHPGGVNPLRMHPDATKFASPPPGQSAAARSLLVERKMQLIQQDSDDELEDLDDVPIYSPSLGDLSQYARSTPPTGNPASRSLLTPGNLHEKTRKVQYETPTRPPGQTSKEAIGRTGKLGLRKSLSNLGLFHKSQSETSMAASPTTRQERSIHGQAISSYLSSPLRNLDQNQKLAGKEVKKSKSMVFGAFSSAKAKTPEPVPSVPRGPYSPATPSPLRQGDTARYPAGTPSSASGRQGMGASSSTGGAGASARQGLPLRPTRPPTFLVRGGKGDGKEVKEWV